ncbi:hypothetical protein [Pseudoalteromonas sp. MMG022]|uniref:hypothetical protein n=1 Tax=Pseudoalteromonas sp. MMG022 TaxID=2909978 RepID=UPI001F1E6821|nr:hypothetical protein [Pseudoalteromonas sp. MMG022]MCF6436246.1 hypothetical protein [Pseudoalteromonas sp. MMG022]
MAKEGLSNAHSKIVSGDFAGGHISNLPIERELTYSGFLAGRICKTCNNGWMSKLEKEVIPLIYKLIDGETDINQITQKERNSLARWGFKTTAALSSSTNAPQNFVCETHSKEFYSSGGIAIPKNVGIFAATTKESEYLWSFSPTWHITAHSDIPQELLQFMQQKSYKVLLQMGHLMLAVCWWPFNTITYTLESWAGIELSGLSNCITNNEDCRKFFDKENDAFLMAIGAQI